MLHFDTLCDLENNELWNKYNEDTDESSEPDDDSDYDPSGK